MIKFLLSIFLIIGQIAFGQSTDSISKIIISYGKSHSSWGEPGVYGKSELIELTKKPSAGFIISRYFTTTASAGADGKTFSKDTIELNIKPFEIISTDNIEFWLSQLNTNKENFTTSFIKPKLTKPTKREIFQVAKKYDKLWMLKGEDANRADTRKGIEEMKSFTELDSFLIFKRPTIEYEMIVTDSYNSIIISTIRNNDTTEYRCQFFEPLGQPIIPYKKGDYSKSSKVFNLEANTSAQKILPKALWLVKLSILTT